MQIPSIAEESHLSVTFPAPFLVLHLPVAVQLHDVGVAVGGRQAGRHAESAQVAQSVDHQRPDLVVTCSVRTLFQPIGQRPAVAADRQGQSEAVDQRHVISRRGDCDRWQHSQVDGLIGGQVTAWFHLSPLLQSGAAVGVGRDVLVGGFDRLTHPVQVVAVSVDVVGEQFHVLGVRAAQCCHLQVVAVVSRSCGDGRLSAALVAEVDGGVKSHQSGGHVEAAAETDGRPRTLPDDQVEHFGVVAVAQVTVEHIGDPVGGSIRVASQHRLQLVDNVIHLSAPVELPLQQPTP